MKLDFDIVSQGGSLDFEIKNTKTINASGGIGEDVVREIIAKETANLQPKRDEALKTQNKEIVGAINELHEREDKQGLTEEQVKAVVRETAVTQESDPTVPAWAKQATKPTYSYNEIKDKPNLFSGNYNDLTNKPTIPSIQGLASESYVNNASAQAVAQGISSHNVDQTAHKDIRNLIKELSNRLNAIADSDDTTLDQLSEIVAYIKANKALIESVTTSKVNVSDIINDLETNVSNKPLSAAQGVALKALINTLEQSVSGLAENAVSDIGSAVAEETNELTIELKDKNGKVVATTKITLPTQEIPEVDLSGYVQFTDVVDNINEKAGLVRLKDYGQGGLQVTSDGFLGIQSPSLGLMESRDTVRPLESSKIENILYLGITGKWKKWSGGQWVFSYGNQKTLTDEEKGYACNWIGATKLFYHRCQLRIMDKLGSVEFFCPNNERDAFYYHNIFFSTLPMDVEGKEYFAIGKSTNGEKLYCIDVDNATQITVLEIEDAYSMEIIPVDEL